MCIRAYELVLNIKKTLKIYIITCYDSKISLFVYTEMDGCADDRSLTPPLTDKLITTKLKENGKQISAAVHKSDDNQTNKSRAIVMSSIANKL